MSEIKTINLVNTLNLPLSVVGVTLNKELLMHESTKIISVFPMWVARHIKTREALQVVDQQSVEVGEIHELGEICELGGEVVA